MWLGRVQQVLRTIAHITHLYRYRDLTSPMKDGSGAIRTIEMLILGRDMHADARVQADI